MSKYDELSKDYVPLKTEPEIKPSEPNDEDYLTDFEDFNLEEPEYINKGPKDEYILELSEGMWTKASSKAVRKIIYLFMRWCGYWVLNLKKWIEQYRKRQEDVEERQTNLENDFKNVRRESLIPNSIKRLKAKRAFVLIQFGLPRPAFKKILAFLFFSASLSISKLTSKAPKPV